MTDGKPDTKGPQRPGSNAEGEAKRKAREDRLAKALRANLARRKAQVRGRDDDGGAVAGDRGKGGDSAE